MKKTSILMFVLAMACCGNALAQGKKVKDHSTDPEHFYLYESEVPSNLKLLPPPPEENSARFAYDIEQYEWGKSQRNTPRGEQAIKDADTSDKGVCEAFSPAFGITISQETTPQLYRLITGMREDLGDLATDEAKKFYKRKRPFLYFNEDTSIPELQKRYTKSGSYPSGHTAIGWGTALVLAEINTGNQEAILKRGYEMGQSRVIAGFHFQSDVDASRWMCTAIVARLHADKEFCKQLKKAKKEFAKLQKQGKIQNVSL